MKQVTLGNTGLTVSAVGFGGIPITRPTDDAAATLVREAIRAGISFFDTAYGYPESEPRIGAGIRAPTAQLVIATKDPSTDGRVFTRHVEESLARLGTDYLDLMQFHNIGTREKWEAVGAAGGAYEAALRLRDEGKVRHIGVTTHDVQLAEEIVESGQFETLQVPLNFVADDAAPLAARCAERGVGFIAMKPFAGGAIEDARLALRYLQQFPTVVAIPGIETPEELRQVVELYEHPQPPTADQRSRMAQLKGEIGKVFCRACGYCQPCPQEIAIAMVLRARSFARRMPVEQSRRALGSHMARVDRCTECRQCVERCPYDLDIPAMLPRMREWFGEWLQSLDA